MTREEELISWENKRREELELLIPANYTMKLSNDRLNLWTGKRGAIEYQISIEREIKEMILNTHLS